MHIEIDLRLPPDISISFPIDIMKLIRFEHNGEIFNGTILEDGARIKADGLEDLKLDEVKLLAPVAPSKIVSVGLNYKDHAKELDMPVPSEPIIFIIGGDPDGKWSCTSLTYIKDKGIVEMFKQWESI